MANFMKMTAASHGGLLENDRTDPDKKGKQDQYHPERVNENFCVIGDTDAEKHKVTFIEEKNWKDKRIVDIINKRRTERLSEIKVLNRKDVKHVVSMVFTCPQEVPQNEQRKCLYHAMYYTAAKFGPRNFLCAFFHFHEKTPHVTVDFIPVVRDKTGKEKCSAKEVVTRSMLQAFHGELGMHLDRMMGYHVSVETGLTRLNGHSINWQKEQTHKYQMAQLKEVNKELESEASYYRYQLRKTKGMLRRLELDNPVAWHQTTKNFNKSDCPSDEDLKANWKHWHEAKVRAGRQRHVKTTQQGIKR